MANIYYAVDKNLNFYWYSPVDSQHSTIIRDNPRIAISIFDSTAVGDDVDAVYISALAKEITGKAELVKGLTVYGRKMLSTGFVESTEQVKIFIKQLGVFQGVSKLRLYKATPVNIWKLAPSKVFNDKYIDSRLEINMDELRSVPIL